MGPSVIDIEVNTGQDDGGGGVTAGNRWQGLTLQLGSGDYGNHDIYHTRSQLHDHPPPACQLLQVIS